MPERSFTVIIPAHNEDAVIARCLDRIRKGAPDDVDMQVIVAANGCTDRTVIAAKQADPKARLIMLPSGSKTRAINAANAVAEHNARIVLDADVECDFHSLAALAEAVRDNRTKVAAPAIRIELSRAGPLVGAYYRVWQRQPYARQGKGGAGCYALSKAALDQVGDFPDIIADDAWIHTRFPDYKRRLVSETAEGEPVFTVVHPPRTAWEQIKVEARRQLGNRELRSKHPGSYPMATGGSGGVYAALRGGSRLTDVVVFFAMKAVARALARWRLMFGQARKWSRDESSRQP